MKSHFTYFLLAPVLGLLVTGCAGPHDPLADASAKITIEEISHWTEVLSSDEYEGRAPSSPGEEKTIAYIEAQMKDIGLEPGNGNSYLQKVPLSEITVQGDPTLIVRGRGKDLEFSYDEDAIVWTKRVSEEVSLEASELVFVGYGTVAPEYGWDDYAGVDVKGKTVVVLVNDPGFATQDDNLFKGNTMTYYGRWTYKYEEASRQGAAAALIIHDTAPAAYGWETVRNSWTGPQFDLVHEDKSASRIAVEGWITMNAAQQIFSKAGQDLNGLMEQARKKDFSPVPLGLTASLNLQNTIMQSVSHNVLGLLPGSERPDEYLIYMAHWDHLGKDESLEGDQIFNGALDNATGIAGLLGLAKAFSSFDPAPKRSIVFMAVTAEEQGLLGSAYYAGNPVYPRTSTVAAINMDALNIHGPMKDITVIGYGNSELDDYVDRVASESGRTVQPDPEPDQGSYYRSDHFSLAKQGVPALYLNAGVDHVEHGREWTMKKRMEYIDRNYHQPGDEYDPTWDLTGAVDDLRIMLKIGSELANSTAFPNWREGSEFRKKRDAEMAGQ